MRAPSTATMAPVDTASRMLPSGPEHEPSRIVPSFGLHTMTPACLSRWEAGLTERTELCLDIAGRPGAKLTVYAGPDDREGVPVAIVTGLDEASYVSRLAHDSDIETWITSILLEIGGESEDRLFSGRSLP